MIGIDVVDLALYVRGEAGHNRKIAGVDEQLEQKSIRVGGATDELESGIELRGAGKAAVDAREAERPLALSDERGDELRVDAAGDDFGNGIDDRGVGDAQAAHELTGDAALF